MRLHSQGPYESVYLPGESPGRFNPPTTNGRDRTHHQCGNGLTPTQYQLQLATDFCLAGNLPPGAGRRLSELPAPSGQAMGTASGGGTPIDPAAAYPCLNNGDGQCDASSAAALTNYLVGIATAQSPMRSMQAQASLWATVPYSGTWSRIRIPGNYLALELFLINVLEPANSLESEPPPPFNCTVPACAPASLEGNVGVVVRFSRRSELLNGLSSARGRHMHDCAYIEKSGRNLIEGGTLAIRQIPPERACPFDLYIWTPARMGVDLVGNGTVGGATGSGATGGDGALEEGRCAGNVGVDIGSTAMDGQLGTIQLGVTCATDYAPDRLYERNLPPAIPAPPRPPPSSPPPPPIEVIVAIVGEACATDCNQQFLTEVSGAMTTTAGLAHPDSSARTRLRMQITAFVNPQRLADYSSANMQPPPPPQESPPPAPPTPPPSPDAPQTPAGPPTLPPSPPPSPSSPPSSPAPPALPPAVPSSRRQLDWPVQHQDHSSRMEASRALQDCSQEAEIETESPVMTFNKEDMTVNGGMQRAALEALELYNTTLKMLAQVSCPGASSSIILRVENLISIDDDVVIDDNGEIKDLPPNVIVDVFSPPPGAPPSEPPPSPTTPPPAHPPAPPSLCTDTCIYSSNGACQDGGRFSILPQACDYGTDCAWQLMNRSHITPL